MSLTLTNAFDRVRELIIMYIYDALINALSAHMIHINLNMIFYTHVEHSPTKTMYIKYYKKYKSCMYNLSHSFIFLLPGFGSVEIKPRPCHHYSISWFDQF